MSPPKADDWKRPFVETSTSDEVVWEKGEKKVVVEFMEADESVGEVQIGFGEGVKRGDLVGELVSLKGEVAGMTGRGKNFTDLGWILCFWGCSVGY